ncbi:hypothetical protein MMC26_006083 [Xylographa opegraphella]|nr:hypothetical protein [Xylographa opegraphella]
MSNAKLSAILLKEWGLDKLDEPARKPGSTPRTEPASQLRDRPQTEASPPYEQRPDKPKQDPPSINSPFKAPPGFQPIENSSASAVQAGSWSPQDGDDGWDHGSPIVIEDHEDGDGEGSASAIRPGKSGPLKGIDAIHDPAPLGSHPPKSVDNSPGKRTTDDMIYSTGFDESVESDHQPSKPKSDGLGSSTASSTDRDSPAKHTPARRQQLLQPNRNLDFHVGNGQRRLGYGRGKPVWIGQYVNGGSDLQGCYPIVIGDFSAAGEFTMAARKHDVDGHQLQVDTELALKVALDTSTMQFKDFRLSPVAQRAVVKTEMDMVKFVEGVQKAADRGTGF